MLRCLEHDEAQKILTELHDGPAGGHFAGDTTAHKIMRAGYYCQPFSKMRMHMSGNALNARNSQTEKCGQLLPYYQ